MPSIPRLHFAHIVAFVGAARNRGRSIRTLLLGLRQEPPPHGRLHRASPGRLGNGRGLHAEDGGQGPAGMAEDLDPEIGEAGAGLLDGEPAAPAHRLAGQADLAAGAEVAEDRRGSPARGGGPSPGGRCGRSRDTAPGAEVRDDLRAQRIEVEVADELQEVRLLLHHDGLVPVLEEVAHPLVAAVEGPGIAREQTPHAAGQRARARPHEEVGMVREEGPGVDGPRPGLRQGREARDKIRPIRSSRKRTRRSSPRTITWWRASGASRRGWRGMAGESLAQGASGRNPINSQMPLRWGGEAFLGRDCSGQVETTTA